MDQKKSKFRDNFKEFADYNWVRDDYPVDDYCGNELEIPKDAIKNIILREMEQQRVLARHVPAETDFTHLRNLDDSKRYFKTRGFAKYICKNIHYSMDNYECYHHWATANSWCYVDLKKQEICYRYTQECRECKVKKRSVEIHPEFTKEAIEKMARWAVRRYLIS